MLLAQSAGDVNRSATARWGTLSDGNMVPLVIADCEFRAPSAGETVTLYLDDPKPQSGCSSLPGGFSQLDKSACSVPISAGGTVAGVTGVGGLQNKVACLTNSSPPALPHTVLIPIYSASNCQVTNCKGKGPYLILGFAALEVTGYSFNGSPSTTDRWARSARTTRTAASTASEARSRNSPRHRAPQVPAPTSVSLRSTSTANTQLTTRRTTPQ